jgi:hypothetical protein
MIRVKCSALAILALFSTGWINSAEAIPAFARQTGVTCSGCHTAFPQLNAFGRQFKEAGYRIPGTRQESSALSRPAEHVPLSAVLVARPYDKKDSGQSKNRALHEVEIIGGGIISGDFSGYFEIEAEDETGFEPEVGPAVLTYNYRKEFNVQMSWAPMFWADPYGILGNHFRLTRGAVGAIDQKFGGADDGGKLRSNRQNVGVYGRVSDRFFYNATWSGDAEDAEGENASIVSGQVNFDLTNNIMVGAFGVSGENEAQNRDFTRTGVQFQADIAKARIQALYITASDDRVTGDPRGPGTDDNDAFSLQAFWTFRDESSRATFVPLVRYDTYDTNDGTGTFDELVLNLGYFVNENVKVYLEYWDRFDAPTPAQEDSRITIQAVAAF